jgi:hypothetical protein
VGVIVPSLSFKYSEIDCFDLLQHLEYLIIIYNGLSPVKVYIPEKLHGWDINAF